MEGLENCLLLFKHQESGEELRCFRTLKDVLNCCDVYDLLPDSQCVSGSCFTESQNFCDCTGEYDDYEFVSISYANKQDNQWISVEERLPETEERVLIVPNHVEAYFIGFINSNNSFWHGIFADGIKHCEVTHWMPLPQPPKH